MRYSPVNTLSVKAILNWNGNFLQPTADFEIKDVRLVPFRYDDGEFSIEPSEGAIPRRIWRDLDELNYTGRIDLTKKIELAGHPSKLKFGAYTTLKDRD